MLEVRRFITFPCLRKHIVGSRRRALFLDRPSGRPSSILLMSVRPLTKVKVNLDLYRIAPV